MCILSEKSVLSERAFTLSFSSSQQIETNDANCSVSSSPSQSASRASTPDTQSSTFYPTYPSYASNRPHAPHENCPDSLDCLPDTDERPQHTLPVILRCAILGSARKRLTIRDIYSAMEHKYPYYKTAGPAWKVSLCFYDDLLYNLFYFSNLSDITYLSIGFSRGRPSLLLNLALVHIGP